jgi:hypothetical protein
MAIQHSACKGSKIALAYAKTTTTAMGMEVAILSPALLTATATHAPAGMDILALSARSLPTAWIWFCQSGLFTEIVRTMAR